MRNLSKLKKVLQNSIDRKKQDAYAPKSPRNEKMAKGGRAGYKYGGAAIKGVSKLLS